MFLLDLLWAMDLFCSMLASDELVFLKNIFIEFDSNIISGNLSEMIKSAIFTKKICGF